MNAERRRFRWVTVSLLVLAAANGLVAVAGEGGWLARRRLERTLAQLAQENHALRIENRALADGLGAVADDPETLEWLARIRLGYIRDGERVYRFERPSASTADATPAAPGPALAARPDPDSSR